MVPLKQPKKKKRSLRDRLGLRRTGQGRAEFEAREATRRFFIQDEEIGRPMGRASLRFQHYFDRAYRGIRSHRETGKAGLKRAIVYAADGLTKTIVSGKPKSKRKRKKRSRKRRVIKK